MSKATCPPAEQFQLSRRTPTAIKKLDAFVSHLHRLLHTREGLDETLLFLAYTTQLTASLLDIPNPALIQTLARRLVARAPEWLAARASSSLSSLFTTNLRLRLSTQLRALVDMLDGWHTMSRLWGLVTMWMIVRDFVKASQRETKEKQEGVEGRLVRQAESAIVATQIVSLIGFFALENTAWLSRLKVLTWSPNHQSKIILWSGRSWAVYIFAELGKLMLERVRKRGNSESMGSLEEWNKKFVSTLAWAPVSIHWTSPGGLLPESVAAGLAAYAQFISVQGLWKQTAKEHTVEVV
ncbi:hypothetical protein FZEAL_8310 [Fusarium zealandicum]|uniref:Peroxin 11C n=1 Tax=Fusarium zealandicum TaxID=1053134 RepID=A0A8H4UE62_9HYPO|nr:hypothetical protein FZEAL_8310 [Fusarium zealandicum]